MPVDEDSTHQSTPLPNQQNGTLFLNRFKQL